MTCDDDMASLNIDDVVLVDTATVSDSGRLYVGKEHAGKPVKLIVVDESEK